VKSKQEEFSNEFRFTRLAAKIIKDNLNKNFIEIGNIIVKEFASQGVVIPVERECGCCVGGFINSVPRGASTVCPKCNGNYQQAIYEPLIEEG